LRQPADALIAQSERPGATLGGMPDGPAIADINDRDVTRRTGIRGDHAVSDCHLGAAAIVRQGLPLTHMRHL
jgi:hypothetical protein